MIAFRFNYLVAAMSFGFVSTPAVHQLGSALVAIRVVVTIELNDFVVQADNQPCGHPLGEFVITGIVVLLGLF